jgi:hypothetical protein
MDMGATLLMFASRCMLLLPDIFSSLPPRSASTASG